MKQAVTNTEALGQVLGSRCMSQVPALGAPVSSLIPGGQKARGLESRECYDSSVDTHIAAEERKERVWGCPLKMDRWMGVTRHGGGKAQLRWGFKARVPLCFLHCVVGTALILFFSKLYIYL